MAFAQSDPQSLDLFFNITCYGVPQYERRVEGMDYAAVYFASESAWLKEMAKFPNSRMPFQDCLSWLKRSVVRWDKKKGEMRRQPRIPLIGNLAAFLLSADLYYAGIVSAPSAAEVATIIRRNGMGSLAGLVATDQISNKEVPVEVVIEAFQDVVNYLSDNLSSHDKDLISFDVVMVEHLLCKYQRVTKELGIAKGKHVN